jgi:hypothetical protein
MFKPTHYLDSFIKSYFWEQITLYLTSFPRHANSIHPTSPFAILGTWSRWSIVLEKARSYTHLSTSVIDTRLVDSHYIFTKSSLSLISDQTAKIVNCVTQSLRLIQIPFSQYVLSYMADIASQVEEVAFCNNKVYQSS